MADVAKVAYDICLSYRQGKAADAEAECSAFANCVAAGGNPYRCCQENVRDPWGTNIFLGWLGQVFAPNSMPSPDCDRIARAVEYALAAIARGEDPVVAIKQAKATADMMGLFKSVIEMQVMMNMLATLKQGGNTINSAVTQVLQLLPLVLLLNVL